MHSIDRFLTRLASWRIALLAAALSAAFFALFSRIITLPAGAPGVVELQLAFTVGRFRDVLDVWGPDAIADYRRSMLPDAVFPLVYATALASALAWLRVRSGQRQTPATRAWCLLPYAAAVFDYGENALHLWILRDTAALSAPLILLASLAAALKWGLMALAVVAIAWLGIVRGRLHRAASPTQPLSR